MRKEVVKRITGVLHEGKILLDLYRFHGYPTEGERYKEFMFDVIGVVDTFRYSELGPLISWLYFQEGNNLEYPSSGSIRVALEDFDGFAGAIDINDDITEEEYEFAHNIYKGLFR